VILRLFIIIKLLLTFYRSFFVLSFLITLVCLGLFLEYGPDIFFILLWLKLSATALIFFFIRTYKHREFYYYQNLGLSRTFLWTTTLLFDFFLYLLLLLEASKALTMTHTLHADNIQLTFGSRSILSNIHLQCKTGHITGLLGRNGTGKSCLMRILYGDLPAASRSVRFDGHPVSEPGKHPHLLVFLPQFNFIPKMLPLPRVLDDFQLEFKDLEKKFPEFSKARRSRIRELSGGQIRLVELYIIARSASRFALLDEPFTHLMPLQIEKIKEILLEEKEKKGFLITDHLHREVTSVSDQLYLLADGATHPVNTNEDLERFGYLPPKRN
jgi:lipopolysaccharide export system ATP-binding protein